MSAPDKRTVFVGIDIYNNPVFRTLDNGRSFVKVLEGSITLLTVVD